MSLHVLMAWKVTNQSHYDELPTRMAWQVRPLQMNSVPVLLSGTFAAVHFNYFIMRMVALQAIIYQVTATANIF